jgi:hypothetical protein
MGDRTGSHSSLSLPGSSDRRQFPPTRIFQRIEPIRQRNLQRIGAEIVVIVTQDGMLEDVQKILDVRIFWIYYRPYWML